MSDFSYRLQELLRTTGTSQLRLSKKLGVAIGTVNKWVHGNAEPSVRNAEALARYFKMSLEELMGRSAGRMPAGLPKDWSLDGDKIRAGLEEGTDSEMLVAVGTRVLEEMRTYKPALAPAQTAQLIALLYGLAMDRLKDGKSRKAALPIGADIRNYAKLLPSTESPPKPRSPKR